MNIHTGSLKHTASNSLFDHCRNLLREFRGVNMYLEGLKFVSVWRIASSRWMLCLAHHEVQGRPAFSLAVSLQAEPLGKLRLPGPSSPSICEV